MSHSPRVIGTNWTGESATQPRAIPDFRNQDAFRPTRRPADRIVRIRRSRIAHRLAELRVFLNTPL